MLSLIGEKVNDGGHVLVLRGDDGGRETGDATCDARLARGFFCLFLGG